MEKIYKSKKQESEYWQYYNEMHAGKFLSFVQEIMGESVYYGESRTSLERVSYLLEHLKGDTLINTISFYFQEYSIEEKGIILTLLQILSKYPYGNSTASMMEAYKKLPMIEDVCPKTHGVEIKTTSGVITVYRAMEALTKQSGTLRSYQAIKKSDVSLRKILLNSRFIEDTVISCLMPRMFGGFSYEYYIKLIKENGYLDLRRNCFYSKSDFEEYFNPKILMRRKGKNLKTDIPPLFKK